MRILTEDFTDDPVERTYIVIIVIKAEEVEVVKEIKRSDGL